jgi:hypothetical protein
MPTHERLGPDDCENLQDEWKPAIQLDKEPAIIVRKPDATMQPAPQDTRQTAGNVAAAKFKLSQYRSIQCESKDRPLASPIHCYGIFGGSLERVLGPCF